MVLFEIHQRFKGHFLNKLRFFKRDVKRCFNLSHVTKVSAQTFATYSAGKNFI